MMKAQVDARKLPPLRTTHLWFAISAGVEVCSLAAGHSGSVLTKPRLFPGLQGSQDSELFVFRCRVDAS
ncbi:unnamed protein product [Pleuronectes platessa]|uniref:Uncharacterized protein n=1 Tax=Pleuronectes platessa TaxID=8262 RepID=A0A9N7VKW3_PLEPL|nr:unnamed protein product [Pleuronectes platessa]